MNIITITNKRHMTYKFYLKHNMKAAEWQLKMTINKNPKPIIALDRSINYPLIRKFSFSPYPNLN